jgi:hypothetical protein
VRWRFRLFGLEIASLERDDDEPPPDGITGGSMHNFDRDDRPLNPDDRYDWETEERFGFQ